MTIGLKSTRSYGVQIANCQPLTANYFKTIQTMSHLSS